MGIFEGGFMNTAKKQTTHAFSQFTLTNKLLQNLYKYKLTPTAKLVLLELSTCYNPKHGDMFPKQKTLANRIGVSERSVVRAVSELVKEGLVLIECKSTNHYKFSSRITSECAENLSEDLRQNDIRPQDNLSAHEQRTKPISKPTDKEGGNVYSKDDQILIDYAIKHGAKNIKAYVAKLKLSKSADKIIADYKKKNKSLTGIAVLSANKTKELLSSWEAMNLEEDCPPIAIPAKFREYAKMVNSKTC